MTTTIILLVLICILNFIDYFQTMYAVQILGIGIELNPIGRFLIENNYEAIPKLVVVPILLAILGFIIHFDKRLKWTVYFLLVWYGCVVISNFNILFRAGLF